MTRHALAAYFCVILGAGSLRNVKAATSVELVSPRGGETWAARSYHPIQFKTDLRHPLRIEYTVDGGANWTEVIAAAPVDGRVLWQLPNTSSAHCRIRVSDPRSDENVQSASEFSITPSQELAPHQWVRICEKPPFAPRDGAGALTFKDRMWFLGGWNPGDKEHFPRICNNEVWSSSDGIAWDLVKPNSFLDAKFDPSADWEGRHTAGYVVYRDKMWLVGGDANQKYYQNDVWNSVDGKIWNYVNKGKDIPWGPRVLQYTVVFKDKIWIMGGQTMPLLAKADEAFFDDIWNTSDGVNWEKVTPNGPHWSPRGIICGSVVFKDRVWILGGGTYDTPTTRIRKFFNDVWSSADGVNWTEHETAPWYPRQYHSVAVFNDRMWVLGGWNNGDRNDVWYSADGSNWYRISRTPWHPRHAASVFVHDNALWIAAGSCMIPDVWKLKLDASAKPADPEIKGVQVALALDGLDARRSYIYDRESADQWPYPVDLVPAEAMPTRIFSKTFDICILDPEGKNVNAEMRVDDVGHVRFEKWNDGGKGLRMVVDNNARPILVTIKRTQE